MLTPWKESYEQPRQQVKKQRHYFANKGPSSQAYILKVIFVLNVLPSETARENKGKLGNPSSPQSQTEFGLFINLTAISFTNMSILKGIFFSYCFKSSSFYSVIPQISSSVSTHPSMQFHV